MKATLSTKQHTGDLARNRKEKHFTSQYSVVAVDKKRCIKEIVTARIYQTSGRAHACVWVHSADAHLTGGGWAGGYGYHRSSAALQKALNDAGITLSEAIDGCGAMETALCAVATALGYESPQIIYAHS